MIPSLNSLAFILRLRLCIMFVIIQEAITLMKKRDSFKSSTFVVSFDLIFDLKLKLFSWFYLC